MKPSVISVIAIVLLCASCGRSREYAPEPIAPLYDIVYEYGRANLRAEDSILEANLRYEPQLEALLATVHDDNVPDSLQLRAWSRSPAVEVFTPAADSVFPSLAGLESQLGTILGRAEEDGLELPRRSYAAIVHGKLESILFADSVMLIALNHYLGAEYEGYSAWPAYSRMLKTPDQLPYDIAEALIATEYPYDSGEHPTVLKRLIYEGALAYAKKQVVPDADEAGVLSMPVEHLAYSVENEAATWGALISRALLFDTSAGTMSRLFDPAPTTSLIDTYAPGRVVRYNGLKLIESYVKKHPGITLAEMLSPDFYNADNTLAESGYNP